MTGSTAIPNDELSLAHVVAALLVILFLALVLPFGAVRTLHARRLQRADVEMQAIASSLGAVAVSIPQGTRLLVGPGNRPIVLDETWNTASTLPLGSVVTSRSGNALTPDPWGNTYFVVTGSSGRPAWVLSAGPDGVLQTPFDGRISGPSGDDRVLRLH